MDAPRSTRARRQEHGRSRFELDLYGPQRPLPRDRGTHSPDVGMALPPLGHRAPLTTHSDPLPRPIRRIAG